MSGCPVTIIAEVGVNHDGDPAVAASLVDACAAAGANVVKFQTFQSSALVAASAPKADYQVRTTGADGGQMGMLKALELGIDDLRRLQARCAARAVEFMSTPFDHGSLDALLELSVRRIKIGSGDLDNAPLLYAAARSGRPLIISTGMSSLGEVEQALDVVAFGYCAPLGESPSRDTVRGAFGRYRDQVAEQLTVLHCTSAYPAPDDSVNLRAMETLRRAFGLAVGLSDHTVGIAIPLAAVALGAAVIEKHVTLSRQRTGPDHSASIEPNELADMVSGIRRIGRALGDGHKVMTAGEASNRAVIRRSVVAARPIHAGARIEAADLIVKRPAAGRPPIDLWSMVGRVATRSYVVDECVDE